MTLKKFTECLNDLRDWFVLGDPIRLTAFQSAEGLGANLVQAFTETNAGDRAAELGVLVPMVGIENYPYTIIFSEGGSASAFDSAESKIQLSRSGYLLEVVSREIYLFTAPYLSNWSERAEQLTSAVSQRPRFQLENGWYEVCIRGGETLQETGLEPTLEFMLQRQQSRPPFTGELSFPFRLTLSLGESPR